MFSTVQSASAHSSPVEMRSMAPLAIFFIAAALSKGTKMQSTVFGQQWDGVIRAVLQCGNVTHDLEQI